MWESLMEDFQEIILAFFWKQNVVNTASFYH